MAENKLAGIRDDVVARILADPENAVAIVGLPGASFAGRPLKGSPATGLMLTDDMGIGTDDALRDIGRSRLGKALAEATGFKPGAETAALLGIRAGSEVRVFLYGTHVDTSGSHPVHGLMLDDGGAAEIGSVVLTCREVLPGGTIANPRTSCPGNRPGSWHAMTAPEGIAPGDVLNMALGNLATVLCMEMPSDRDLAEGWRVSEGTNARIPSRPEPTHRVAVAAPAKAPKSRIDMGKLAARLEALTKVAYLPNLRPATDADGVDAQGNGGLAFIPAGSAWPQAGGGDLPLVAQLDVAAMPDEARALLGGAGLLQLFCSGGDDPGNCRWAARVVDPGLDGTWQAMADEEGRTARFVLTGWRAVREGPCLNDLSEGPTMRLGKRLSEAQTDVAGLLCPQSTGVPKASAEDIAYAADECGLDPAAAEEVAEILRHHDGDKLLGWPTWCQAPEWPAGREGKGMVHLLQLSFAEGRLAPELMAGDGQAHLFVSTDGKLRFAFDWACG